jgi:hypothetical protein
MNSNRYATFRLGATLIVALLVLVSAVACGSDDEGSAPTEAATTNGDSGTGAIASLQEAQAQLCSRLSDVEADLTEVSTSGTEAGQDVLARLASFAAALEASAATLTTAGAADAATAAENLASDLESLSDSSGEDAQARAGEAADSAQELTEALQCS